MHKGAKIFWTIVFLAACGAGAVAVLRSQQRIADQVVAPKGPEPFRIGAVLPLTGEGAIYGIPIQRAGMLALHDINRDGGIGGRPLEIVWEDGKCNAQAATAAAKRILANAIRIILGGVCSSETLAMAPITQGARAMLLSPSATSPDISTAGDLVFRMIPSQTRVAAIAADEVVRTQARAIVVLTETRENAQVLRRAFLDTLALHNGNVVIDDNIPPGIALPKELLDAIKKEKPDVLALFVQTPALGLKAIDDLRAAGITVPIITTETLVNRDLVRANAKTLQNATAIVPFFDATTDSARAFLTSYKNTYDEQPPFPQFMANMYAGVRLIHDAIEQGAGDTTEIRAFLDALDGWRGASGILTFDDNGDALGSYATRRLEQGKLVEVPIVVPTPSRREE